MSGLTTARERAYTSKTLVCLLQSLPGRTTTIDLRNETSVTGFVQNVDAYMNTEMENVDVISPSGQKHHCDNFFVQGRQIRFVHIPEDMDMISAIKDKLSSVRRVRTHQDRAPDTRLRRETRKMRQKIIESKANA